MATTPKLKLPIPDAGRVPTTAEVKLLRDIIDASACADWGQDVAATAGDTYAYLGGVVPLSGVWTRLPGGTFTMPAGEIRYIERHREAASAGAFVVRMVTALSIDTAVWVPMAKIDRTGESMVVTDMRPTGGTLQGPRGLTGDPCSLTIGTVAASAPGSPAEATVTGTAPNQALNLVLPRGDQGTQGIQGVPGDPCSLTIGTVTTSAPGSSAEATVTGTAPNQTLNLVLPQGATGPVGAPCSLTIGTVTTSAPGSSAEATVTGTAPNQTLNLVLPQGAIGPQGPQGPAGTVTSNSGMTVGTDPGGTETLRVGGSIRASGITLPSVPANSVMIAITGGAVTYTTRLTYDNSSGVLRVGGGTGYAGIDLDGVAPNRRLVTYKSNGVLRADFGLDNSAEAGSDAGSNVLLRVFTDAGAVIDNPIIITRAAGGTMTLSRPVTAAVSVAVGASPPYQANSTLSLGGTPSGGTYAFGMAMQSAVTAPTAYGSWINPTLVGTANAIGLDATPRIETGVSTTVTNAYAIQVALTKLGTGTISNAYGLKILDITVGGTNHAVYTGLGNVSFGGKLVVRDTTASTSTTTGSATFAGGVGIAGALHSGSVATNTFGTTGGATYVTMNDAYYFERGGGSVVMRPGTADSCYISFHPRTATPTTRGGYFGYDSAATTIFTLKNEISGGHIQLLTTGTGRVIVNNPLASASTTSGCATFSGGVGVDGALYMRTGVVGVSTTMTALMDQFQVVGTYTWNSASNYRLWNYLANPTLIVPTGTVTPSAVVSYVAQPLRNRSAADDSGQMAGITGMLCAVGHLNVGGSNAPVTTVVEGVSVEPYAMSGTINTLYGYRLRPRQVGGTVNNYYGLWLSDVSGAVSNNFAIYTNAGANSLGGTLTVRDTTDSTSTTTGCGVFAGGVAVAKNFTTGAGRIKKYLTITAATTLDATHHTVYFNNATGFTQAIPAAAANGGREYHLENIGDGPIVLDPNGTELIGLSTTLTLLKGQGVTIQSDGTNWRIQH